MVPNGGYGVAPGGDATAHASTGAGRAVALNTGGTIDDTSISYANVTSASLNPVSDVLTLVSGATPTTVALSGNLQGVSLGLSSDGAGGTEIVDLGVSPQVNDPVSPGRSVQQTVIMAGSSLQFVNTYDSTVGQGYEDAIVTAENFYQSQIATAATLDFEFGMAPGVGAGSNSYSTVNASFSQLQTALANAATSPDDKAAVAAIGALAGEFAGSTFQIADPLAQVLGLPGVPSGASDTTQLDSTLSYFYSQNNPVAGAYDAVAVLEHEISEGGLGRVGGDGNSPGIMDIFRYAAAGVPDSSLGRDGNPAYFSINGTQLLTQFHNPIATNGYNDGADSADWDASGTNQQPTYIPGQPNAFDAYGVVTDGAVGVVTATDLRVLDVLGWTLAGTPAPPPPLPTPTPTQRPLADQAPSDFNGDGVSDILWHNSNGDTAIWYMSSTGGFTPVDLGVVDTSWSPVGTGDFNADGKSDILWRNTNGEIGEWLANGTAGGAGFVKLDLGHVDTSWVIQGTGDFNGDGTSDILWRNTSGDAAIWYSVSTGGYSPVDLGVVDPSWSIQQIGDFNADGKADIWWRNANGEIGVWFANGSAGGAGFTKLDLGNVSTSWVTQGVGDFNGDHTSDLLWRNTSTGDAAIWFMTSTGGYTPVDLGVVDLSWTIAGVGDYNADGRADILWRNKNGDIGEWLSTSGPGFNGFTKIVLTNAPTSWSIVSSNPPVNVTASVAGMAHAMAAMGAHGAGAALAPAVVHETSTHPLIAAPLA